MPGKKHPATGPEIEWGRIKDDFEKEIGAGELSRKYRCAASSVSRKAAKEGWKASKKKGAGKKDRGRREDFPEDHKELWDGIKKRLAKGLRNGDAKKGLEELKVAKIAGEVLSSVIKGERLALGLDEGGPDDIERIAAQMDEATAAPGPEEALD